MRRRLDACIVFLAIVTAADVTVAIEAVEIEEILRAQAERFEVDTLVYTGRKVTTRDFPQGRETSMPPPPIGWDEAAWSTVWEFRNSPIVVSTETITLAGKKFRFDRERTFPDPGGPKDDRSTIAFNENLYQRLRDDTLIVQRGLPDEDAGYLGGEPLIFGPFDFLVATHRRALAPEEARQEATWMPVKNISRVIGEKTLNGRTVTLVEVQAPDQQIMRVVYFSQVEGWFPVRTDTFMRREQNGDLRLASRITVETVGIDGGQGRQVYYPAETVKEIFNADGERTEVRTTEFTISSINEAVSNDDFTISPMLATHYVDNDNPQRSFSNDLSAMTRALLRDRNETSAPLESESANPSNTASNNVMDSTSSISNEGSNVQAGVSSRIWLVRILVVTTLVLVLGLGFLLLIRKRTK